MFCDPCLLVFFDGRRHGDFICRSNCTDKCISGRLGLVDKPLYIGIINLLEFTTEYLVVKMFGDNDMDTSTR